MTSRLQEAIFVQLKDRLPLIAAPWEPLKGARILITGGTGFFGLWILSALKILNDLKKYDIHATVITRNPNPLISQLPSIHNDRNLTFFVGDIKTIQLGKIQCDFLIHGATTSAQETFDGVNDLSKFDLLVDGTRNLMRQVDQCKRAIFLSSGVVYGTSDRNEEKTEVDLWAPPTVGAQLGLANGKRAAEFIFSENCRSLKIDFQIARCFSFIGAGLPYNIHYAIGNFVVAAIQNADIVIQTDGRAVRSFMDMRDFILWLGLLLGKGSRERVFNIGSPVPLSIAHLASEVVRALNSKSRILIMNRSEYSVGNQSRSHYVPSVELFQKEFNPPHLISIEDAIRDYALSINGANY